MKETLETLLVRHKITTHKRLRRLLQTHILCINGERVFLPSSETDIKKIMGDSEKSEHVEEELADVFFFILRFAQMNNIDLHDALTDKLEKNAKKYPIDMIKGKNLKYTEI